MTPEGPILSAERPGPHWGYQDLALFLGAVLPIVAVAYGLVSALFGFTKKQPGVVTVAATAKALLFNGVAVLFLIGALYLIVSLRYGKPFWRSLGWRLPISNLGALLVAGPVMALTVGALGSLLKMTGQPSEIDDMITGRFSLLMLAFYGVILAPIFEETVFRGFLFPLFSRSLGPWWAIVLTALPFGLLHGPEYHWAWQSVLLISGAGAVFGLVRFRSGSTAASFVLHAAYNATQFALVGLVRWTSLT